ncbi:MAG: hypothetical protein ABI995_04925 [Acidobacteriota bacterium]
MPGCCAGQWRKNPQHDHPTIITYRLEGQQTLVATLEGDEGGQHKKQEFRFQGIADGARP